MKIYRAANLIFLFFLTPGIMNGLNQIAYADDQAGKKVAILVTRVGNRQAFAPMTDISFKTDYSNRTPKLGTDVYVDDDRRLKESIPDYPKYPGYTADYQVEFFRNITPEIFKALKEGFENKGYEVLDLKKISESWSKPFSEMTVKEINASLGNNAQFLFIMHYMDIGNSNIHSKTYGVKATNSGFTALLFTYSLFDIQKQKRIFSYSPILGLAVIPSIIYNPEIMTHPDLQKRISVTCKKTSSTNDTEITHDFTDDELIKLLLGHLVNGFHCPDKKFIDCYDECKYYDLKSLTNLIP